MKRIFNRDRRKEFRLMVESAFAGLSRTKNEKDRDSFNRILKPILPGVRSYIRRRLANAVRNGYIPLGKYKVEDLINELYLLAYDKIGEVKVKEELRGWLIQKADELFRDITTHEEFDHYFIDNIDKYTKIEWEEMQGKYTADGDGDLVMLEEVEDSSYPQYEYTLDDVFMDNPEDALIEKLNKELSDTEIHEQVDMVLHRLPLPLRSVFNLAVNHNFSIEEIAKIQMMPVSEVQRNLEKARKCVQSSFKGRYSDEKIHEHAAKTIGT